jgi:hypothetical protein
MMRSLAPDFWPARPERPPEEDEGEWEWEEE